MIATSHVWLLSTCNEDREAEFLYLIIIHFNLNKHTRLMATILDSTALIF